MHPLLSTIHPTLRVALTAWLLGRLISWSALYARGGLPWAWLTPQDAGQTLGWSALVRACLWLDGRAQVSAALPSGVAASAWAMSAVVELALLGATVAVYHLSRLAALPQGAERATWMWALSPLMALTLMPQGRALALGCALALMALACVERARYAWAALLFGLAVSVRLDVALAAPALAWLGRRAWAPGRAPWAAPWLLAAWAVGLVPLSVFGAMLMGGRLGVSLRTLHAQPWLDVGQLVQTLLGSGGLRAALSAGALTSALTSALVSALLMLLWRARAATPGALLALALPCLGWPLLFEGHALWGVAGVWMMASPAFVALAAACEDPARERPVLAALILGQLALAQLA